MPEEWRRARVGPIGVLRRVGAISNSGMYTSLALQRGKRQGRWTCIFDLNILSKMFCQAAMTPHDIKASYCMPPQVANGILESTTLKTFLVILPKLKILQLDYDRCLLIDVWYLFTFQLSKCAIPRSTALLMSRSDQWEPSSHGTM